MTAANSNSSLRLVFQDGSSNKFWEISLSDCEVTVRFGRIGTAGQAQTKSFDSTSAAKTHHDKLVAEKRKKGYVDDGAASTATPVEKEPSIAKTPAPAIVTPNKTVADLPAAPMETSVAESTIQPATTEQTSSGASAAKALFNQWWEMSTAQAAQSTSADGSTQVAEPEPNSHRPLTLENLAEASSNGWAGTIASMFTGVSEPKRSAMRKEFLKEHQLYGTTYNSITGPNWKKASFATRLIDIALGNRQELLYAIIPAVRDFPAEAVKILKERPADWILSAVQRHLLANPFDAFTAWAELVAEGLLTAEWDDRTLCMIGDSNFRESVSANLDKYGARIPELTNQLHRLLVCDSWATSDPSVMLDIIKCLRERGQLNRVLWIRTALHGHYQINNQNHTRSCVAIVEHLAPNVEELEQCQGEMAAVLDQAKPLVFESLILLLNRLSQAHKLDWSVIGPSLSGIFARAGLAQSKLAIQLLASGANGPTIVQPLQALCSALMHSKREVAELAWKKLEALLTPGDSAVIEQLRSLLPHVSENLRRQIERSSVVSAGSESAASSSEQTGRNSGSLLEAPPSLNVPVLESFPTDVVEALKLRDAISSLETQQYLPCAPWNIMHAPVLDVQRRLEPIGSLDELVLRLGAASAKGATVDERELLLDGICRFSRLRDGANEGDDGLGRPCDISEDGLGRPFHISEDGLGRPSHGLDDGLGRPFHGSSFAVKVAAIKKLADASDGFLDARLNPDFAMLIRAWLGLERPDRPEGGVRFTMEEISQHRSVAVEGAVRRGETIQLVSISTHTGGWIDPNIFLDRVEQAELGSKPLYLPDLELGILRLAPDGRTTHWRNPNLIARAQRLKGPYAPMIRYAMGDDIAEGQMQGSQRLWVAAIKSRDAYQSISEELPFSKGRMENGEPCKLPLTAVRMPPKWHYAYSTVAKRLQSGRGYGANLIGADLDRGMAYKPHILSIGAGVQPAADNYFITRFLVAQIFEGRFFQYIRRSYWPAQLDWYWYCLTGAYVAYASNKTDFDMFDDIEPLLEPERPLTTGAARILWISSMTRAEKHRLWTTEAWAQLIDDDRLDIPLLLDVLIEFKDQMWIVPKRWSEVLTPVVGRSPLHAWDMAKLVLGMLQTFPFDAKDVAPLLEIVLEAYTWLGLSADAQDTEAMRRFATGKSKKVFEAIAKLAYVEDGEAATARQMAIQTRVAKRFERAQRFSAPN